MNPQQQPPGGAPCAARPAAQADDLHNGSHPPARRKEIYRYSAAEPLFASGWSNKVYPNARFRMAAATMLEDEHILSNKLFVVELDDELGELVRRASFDHGYPSSAIQFVPSTDPGLPELVASATNHLKICRYHPHNQSISLECELFSDKSGVYSSPLTSLSWNEVEPSLVGVSSIDTTCTIWNIEVGQAVGQTPPGGTGAPGASDTSGGASAASNTPAGGVHGSVKTQLIAHEKPVHDIAFSRLGNGRDKFATAGADGSVRLFDLRDLQHSTILYEDIERRSLNHVRWNTADPTKLATVAQDSVETVVLDARVPCRTLQKLGNHKAGVNGLAWAPHSGVHICTAGSDSQALIWQTNNLNPSEPILAYSAGGEINQVHWANNFHQWICICFNNHLEILRV